MENSDFVRKPQNEISPEEVLRISQKTLIDLFPQRKTSRSLKLSDTLDQNLALDSLARVEFLSRIEKYFGASFSEKDFVQMETLRDVFLVLLKSKGFSETSIDKEIELIGEKISQPAPSDVRTLLEVLDWHVQHHPEQTHVQFYEDVGEGETFTYRELKEKAENIAAGLQSLGIKKSEKIILMLPTGKEYLSSFFGVLLAAGVPVPIYPLGRPNQLEDHIRRHQYILSNCQASIIIAPSEVKPIARLLKIQVASLKRIISVAELSSTRTSFIHQEVLPTHLAMIQYTSGSTGTPKGVMLTHENLLSNIRAMGEVLQVKPNDLVVSWLPLYHDMGLIGAWLGSLYFSVRLVLMSPMTFLTHPERWLWAIHRYRATISAAPNFAYELCLHRISENELKGLDLSSLRAFINGAEAVSPETVDRFTEGFQKFGFKKEVLLPVYGLAESSVGLCFPPVGRGPITQSINRKIYMESAKAVKVSEFDPTAIRFVGCGFPLPGHKIRIVDKFQHELPENIEGEIQFCGPSATSGYFDNIDKTKKLFVGSWLETGDRGYISNGELFITGRIKDIIIRGGRHIYPQEIETAVGNIQGIRKGRVVAFGGYDSISGTEKLIVAAETREINPEILNVLKQQINKVTAEFAGDPPEEVVLTPPGAILKTSSGKLRRSATRELYEQGQLGLPPRALWSQVSALLVQGVFNQTRFFLKNLGSQFYAFYCWILFLCLALVAWLIAVLWPRLQWRWSAIHWILKFFFKVTATDIRTIGNENNLLPTPAQIIVSNHSSYLDSLVLFSILSRPVCFVAKNELSKNALLSLALKRLNTQFIERFDLEKSLVDTAKIEKVLNEYGSLLFFPEGTFDRRPGLLPFHSGAFFLAAKKNFPLTPVCIRGTRAILRDGSWFPRRGPIEIFIGETIRPVHIPLDFSVDVWKKTDFLKNYARNFIEQNNQEQDRNFVPLGGA
ncbi:MAG: AMP-binding protein [Bdellovibrio sp.]